MFITAAAPFAHPFFPFFLLIPLFWAAVIVVVAILVTRSRRRWWTHSGPSAEHTLAERFARGDIEEQEYRARLEVLRANRL